MSPLARSCAEVGTLLHPFADDALAASERSVVEEHLAGCPSCTRETARIRENLAFLRETLGPLRMADDFDASFLLRLPRRTAAAPGASPAAAAPPRSRVYGDAAPRRSRSLPAAVVVAVVAGAAGLAWWLGREGPRDPRPSPPPPPPVREPRGVGPADPRPRVGPPVKPPPPPVTDRRPATGPNPLPVVRTGAELVASLRAAKAGGWGPLVQQGWSLLLNDPSQAPAVRAAADEERSAEVRAALVLILGADDSEENRAAARSHLSDASPAVREAAILAMARAGSFRQASKRAVPAGPPLLVGVDLGAIADEGLRADLVAALATEPETGPRRVLLSCLAPSAKEDEAVRGRLLEGVKGAYGEELREESARLLQGAADAAMVGDLADIATAAATSRRLRDTLLETMAAADMRAAAEAVAAKWSTPEEAGTRRVLLDFVARGGAAAEEALKGAATSDPDAAVRVVAVHHLAKLPGDGALATLQRVADDDADSQVRQAASTAAETMKAALERARERPAEDGGGDGGPER